ncbi:hypothetical protein QZH41_014378, partial [Actinostola sp. cb2023]
AVPKLKNMEHLADIILHPLAIPLLALLVVIVIVYCVGTYNYWVLRDMNIPGAKPLPYIGNLRDMARCGGIHLGILEYMKKYGKVFSLCIGRKASIVIADPELLKQIMVKDFHNFTNRDRDFTPRKHQKDLLQLKDGDWRRVRSILTPTFTSGKLKMMIPLIEKSCETLVDKIQDIADSVILATAFGVESPIQTDSSNNKFLIKSRALLKSPIIFRVLLMLPFSTLWVRIFMLLTGRVDFFRNVARDILKARRNQGFQGARDLVDMMLSAKNADGSAKLDDDEIISQSMVFLLAGHETSSNALSMSAYYLALNPDVQERLRCEILIAQQTNPDTPLYELVQELEYLECVINEVLRLSPPAHMVNRACSKSYKINGITTIPAGVKVIIPIYSLHHDPEAWPDVEKFDPERFRGPAKESRHPFQFIPFGEGPRNCIGERFALLEVKITLVNILTNVTKLKNMEHLADIILHPLAILLALLVVIVIIYCVGTYNYWVLSDMNIPGAKPLPYIGNLRDMARCGGFHLGVLEYMKKYGKVFSLCIGRKASIVIADPELLKQIMVKDFHNFTNRQNDAFPPDKHQKGLFQLQDGDWRRVRSVLTPTFTSGKLKMMIPLIEKSCETLVDKIQDIADSGKSVDIFSWFSLMTLEVILSTAFGVESPIQTDSSNNKFLINSREIFKSTIIFRVFLMLPFSQLWISIFRMLFGRFDFFRNAARDILKARRNQGFQGARDLVDIMLSVKNADGSAKLDDDEIISQSIVFLLAGHETSSNTLAMSAYYLALNPDVQERLRCEILIAQQTNPDMPLYELVQELEYLDCVINEVLRLSPAAHSVNRACCKPYKINDDTTIPAGMEVIIPIYSLHHDPDAWLDVEKFDPERFRGPAKESRHPFQFLPFGEGPRNCIGKRFALLEVKITLVNILTNVTKLKNMEHLADIILHPLAILLALLVVVVIVYCVGTYNYWVLSDMNIPGAKPLPYIGNLRDMTRCGGIHLGILEYMKKYGKVFSLCIGRKASIVIADPELLKQILVKDFHNFTNRYLDFTPKKHEKGIFQSRDGDWRRVRSVLTPTFTSGKLKMMIPLIEKSCETLVDKIQDIADSGQSVDIFSWFSLMTLEVILSTAFGVESPVQTDGSNNKFLINSRRFFKSPIILRVFLVLSFSKLWIAILRMLIVRSDFFRNVARDILKARRNQGFQGARDLVDIMLSAKNADGSAKLDDDEVISLSVSFLLAGHETSSNTLSVSAYYLALNPDVQERLRCEILKAQQTNPDTPLYELVQELEYLDCVINEVLRLSPAAHMVTRCCPKPYKINDDTTIPAGMEVIFPIYSLHHDPEAWPEVEKFDPERFRGPAKESRHPFQFIPFSEGPRNCIGKRFALLEVKITLVNILTKYKFVRCPETQVPLKMMAGITLIPKDGVFVRIESCN